MKVKMTSQMWAAVAGALGLAAIVGVASRKTGDPAPAKPTSSAAVMVTTADAGAPLRIAIPTSCGAGLVVLAQAHGLFSKAGMPVELIQFQNGRRALKAMLAGEVDLAITGDLPVVAAALERSDFAVLSAVSRVHFDHWVVARPPLRVASDLKGKRIATQKGTGAEYILDRFLGARGLLPADVEVVDMPDQDMARGLATSRVDAVVIAQPFFGTPHDPYGADVEAIGGSGGHEITFVLVGRRASLLSAPTAIKELLRLMIEAETSWTADRAHATEEIATTLMTEHGRIKADCALMSLGVVLDAPLVKALDDEQRWFLAHGKAPGKPSVDVRTWLAPEPLRALRPDSVHLE